MSLLFTLLTPAWASDVLVPEATPASMDDFSISYTVYSMVVAALEKERLSVDDGDEIREWAGDIADGCSLIDECPGNLFARSQARLALVMTIGQSSRGLNVEARFYGAEDTSPLKVLRQSVSGGGEQEFSKKLAKTAVELLPLLPERVPAKSSKKSSSKAVVANDEEESPRTSSGTWSSRYGGAESEEEGSSSESSKSSKSSRYDEEEEVPPAKNSKSSKSSRYEEEEEEPPAKSSKSSKSTSSTKGTSSSSSSSSKSKSSKAEPDRSLDFEDEGEDFEYAEEKPKTKKPKTDRSYDEDLVAAEFELSRSDAAGKKAEEAAKKIDSKRRSEDEQKKKLEAAARARDEQEEREAAEAAAAAKAEEQERAELEERRAETERNDAEARKKAKAKAAEVARAQAEAEEQVAAEAAAEARVKVIAEARAEALAMAKLKADAVAEAKAEAAAMAKEKADAEAKARADDAAAEEADQREAVARMKEASTKEDLPPIDFGDGEEPKKAASSKSAEKAESSTPAVAAGDEDLLELEKEEAREEASQESAKAARAAKSEAEAAAKKAKAETEEDDDDDSASSRAAAAAKRAEAAAKKASSKVDTATKKAAVGSSSNWLSALLSGGAGEYAGDSAAAKERARLGVPWGDYAKYKESGLAEAAWLKSAKVHAGHGYVEAGGGYAIGDVDRGYGVRVEIDADFESSAVSTWTGSGASEGGAPVGRLAVGYVPSWFLDTSVAFGIQGGQKHLNTGWHCTEGCELSDDETPYAAVDAAQFTLEPRVRVLPLATGLVKPFALTGLHMAFYDAFHVPDENTAVKYPDVASGIAFGFMAGAGVMIDPTPNLSVLVEVPFTYVLSDGTARSIDPALPLVPTELEGNGWTLHFVAGVQARL